MADESNFSMVSVVSTQIQEVGFDAGSGKGRVRFLAKGNYPSTLYEYEGCTEDEFARIVAAPSVGIMFTALWKDSKPYQRIE